jgi:hypothetical protein
MYGLYLILTTQQAGAWDASLRWLRRRESRHALRGPATLRFQVVGCFHRGHVLHMQEPGVDVGNHVVQSLVRVTLQMT